MKKKLALALVVGISLLVLGFSQISAVYAEKVKGVNDPGWHGMCILNGEASEYIVDESKEKKGRAVPLYIYSHQKVLRTVLASTIH